MSDKFLAALGKMEKNRPIWITWQNGDDVMMQASDQAKHGCGMLIYKLNGDVIAKYNGAAQIMKDHRAPKAKARATVPVKNRDDESGVQFDKDFLFVDHLMRLQDQGIGFAALASDPRSEESKRFLVNAFANDAWRLLAMVASGDSDGLDRLSNLVKLRKKIAITPRNSKELAEISGDIELAAAEIQDETEIITPPFVVDVVKTTNARLLRKTKKTWDEAEIRRKIKEAGFGWLPNKWQRKA